MNHTGDGEALRDSIAMELFSEHYVNLTESSGEKSRVDGAMQLFSQAIQSERAEARKGELVRVSDHLTLDEKDRFVDTDVYTWMWEVECEAIDAELKGTK